MRAWLAAALLLALTCGARAAEEPPQDVYYLNNGDRVSGRTVSKGRKNFGLLTRHGRLNIPKTHVLRIQWSDGREESYAGGVARLVPVKPPIGLVVTITGRSFWQAWDPKEAPSDASLRLELTLDEAPLVSYVDAGTDAEDLPGATVNSFHFAPADIAVRSAPGVQADPPETRPGRITLRLHLPARLAGEHRLRLAYQTNHGPPEAPAWGDLVGAAVPVSLKPGAPAVLGLSQDAGRMEYSRRRMRGLESFRLELRPLAAQPPAELDTSRPES